jgi:outer membrane protein, adhesin transport system
VYFLGLVKKRVHGVKAPPSDTTQTEERVAAATAGLALVQQAHLEAQARFRQVIGLEPRGVAAVQYPRGLPATSTMATSVAFARNPRLRALDADIDTAKWAKEQSKSEYWPTVSLEANANWGEDLDGTPGKNDEYNGKVVLSWNLFNGFITTNRKRELGARLRQTQFEFDAERRQIVEMVERAFAAYAVGGQRLKAIRAQSKANSDLVVSYQEEYQLSKRSLLDLLDAERAKFDSQFQLHSIEAVHHFAAYQLLASMGVLLSTLGISPPPETRADFRHQSQDSIFNIDIEPLRK